MIATFKSEMSEKNIFLLLGSNVGDRLANLRQAIGSIENQLEIVLIKSQVYETGAWGKKDQSNFLNQAVQVESTLSPERLLSKIQLIEESMGRTRTEKWGERIIDIDIIYFGNEIINRPDLMVPHPLMQERRFVLVPLVEIAPYFIHPQRQKSNTVLLSECIDNLPVKIFTS